MNTVKYDGLGTTDNDFVGIYAVVTKAHKTCVAVRKDNDTLYVISHKHMTSVPFTEEVNPRINVTAARDLVMECANANMDAWLALNPGK